MLKKNLLLTMCCLFIGNAGYLRADTLIAPDDVRINYYGRFDFSSRAAPAFAWPGSAIEANIPGPQIGYRMIDSRGNYAIEVDGVLDTVVYAGSGDDVVIGSDFTDTLHRVKITLINEHHYNTASFRGFYCANGKEPGPAPEKPARKIEFIGDSYTAGYGIESSAVACTDSMREHTTNVKKSFASLVTGAFHAQSTILAWSGAGVVRNYGEPTQRGQTPYPSRYGRTLSSASGVKWQFGSWIPDLVVICLGTNDYSTEPTPDDSMFIGDYHALIERIIVNYPDAAIACVATHDSTIRQKVSTIVSEEQGGLGHPQVFKAVFPDSMELSACDYHPSISDNEHIAALLIETIMMQLGWDTAATAIANRIQNSRRATASSALAIKSTPSGISFSIQAGFPIPPQLYLVSLTGVVIDKRETGLLSTGTFSPHRLPAGIYVIGSDVLGWQRVVVKR